MNPLPFILSFIPSATDLEGFRHAVDDLRCQMLNRYKDFIDIMPFGPFLEGAGLSALIPANRHIRSFLNDPHQAMLGFHKVVQETFLDKLDRPCPLTWVDVEEAFLSHLLVPDDEFSEAFDRFVGYLWHKGSQSHSDILHYPCFVWDYAKDINEPLTIVSTPFEVAINSVIHGQFQIAIEFCCSDRALSACTHEIKSLVKTALDAASSILTGNHNRMIEKDSKHMGLTLTEEGRLRHPINLIESMCEAGFGPPDKKDSIERRLRNAVTLLVEADLQSNWAVQIALSVAATEALVGQKGESIARQISENLAVLLEPDLSRRGAAESFIKKIYDYRSRVLHGEKIEGDWQTALDAQALASAAIFAFIERREFMTKAGYPAETPDDLLRELKSTKYRSGQPIGVSEYPVREFWNDDSK